MATITSSFTAKGVSSSLFVKKDEKINISISGTFVATIVLEYSDNNQSWNEIKSYTSAASGQIVIDFNGFTNGNIRLRCAAFTSGTAVCSVSDVKSPVTITTFNFAKGSKVGATAGWVVGGAADTSLVTLPASQTASTLVLPLHFTNSGKKIVGFYLIGQVESAGNTVTLDCVLKKHNAVAADVTTTDIQAMTQLSLTADTALTSANSLTAVRDHLIDAECTYFALITGTTAASTDVALQGFGVLLQDS